MYNCPRCNLSFKLGPTTQLKILLPSSHEQNPPQNHMLYLGKALRHCFPHIPYSITRMQQYLVFEAQIYNVRCVIATTQHSTLVMCHPLMHRPPTPRVIFPILAHERHCVTQIMKQNYSWFTTPNLHLAHLAYHHPNPINLSNSL